MSTIRIKATNVLDKHPDEVLYRSVDFADWLESGESLSGTPTVTPDPDSGLTCNTISISGTKVRFKITGGTISRSAWLVTVQVDVAGGVVTQTWVAECRLKVTEFPYSA